VKQQDVRDRFEATGMDVRSGSADELRKLLASDIDKWRRLVKEQNISITQ
jgi:tripartite-type tricarboxylate transporter receptor subunit TctC